MPVLGLSTHHGTSPIQAEIGLITRNVKIRSTSPTLMSYVYCTALATVTASWAEFYYIGLAHQQAWHRGRWWCNRQSEELYLLLDP